MYNNIFQVSTEPFTSDRLATATEVLYFANLPMSDVRSVEDRAYALQDFKKWMKTNKYGNCDSKRFICIDWLGICNNFDFFFSFIVIIFH